MNKRLFTVVALFSILVAARGDHASSLEYQLPADVETGGRLAVAEADAEILPLWRPWPGRAVTLGGGVGARLTLMDFSGSVLEDRELYAFRVPLQASIIVNDKTRLLARLTPGLNSDLEEVDSQDYRLNALLLAFYSWRPRIQLGGGLMLGDSTGHYRVLPAAGVRWTATDNLVVDLFMPRPRLVYKITEAWSVFASAGPAGGQWNIGNDGTPDDPERDLHYEALSASLGGEWRIRPGMSLTLSGGGLFNRSLETEDAPDPELGREVDVDDTLFIALALRLSSAPPRRPASP